LRLAAHPHRAPAASRSRRAVLKTAKEP